MMKKELFTGAALLVVSSAIALPVAAISVGVAQSEGSVMCTQEAKLCPDGSYVGRTGLNCAFAACPTGVSVGGSAGASVSGSADSSSFDASAAGEADAPLSSSDQSIRGSLTTLVNSILGRDAEGVEGDTETNSSTSISDSEESTFVVTRANVESGSTLATTLSPVSVRTNLDLTGYAAAQIENDEHVDRIHFSDSDVSVVYRMPAEFLGFLSSSVKVTASVDAEGNVDVVYPWYVFLFSAAEEAELEAAIDERLDVGLAAAGSLTGIVSAGAEANASAEASATMEMTAQTKARVIEEVRAALETAFEASLQARVDAKASAQTSIQQHTRRYTKAPDIRSFCIDAQRHTGRVGARHEQWRDVMLEALARLPAVRNVVFAPDIGNLYAERNELRFVTAAMPQLPTDPEPEVKTILTFHTVRTHLGTVLSGEQMAAEAARFFNKERERLWRHASRRRR